MLTCLAGGATTLPVPLQLPYGLLALIQLPCESLHCLVLNGQIHAHTPHGAQQLGLLLGSSASMAEQRECGVRLRDGQLGGTGGDQGRTPLTTTLLRVRTRRVWRGIGRAAGAAAGGWGMWMAMEVDMRLVEVLLLANECRLLCVTKYQINCTRTLTKR